MAITASVSAEEITVPAKGRIARAEEKVSQTAEGRR